MFGAIALILAIGAAGWLLWRSARGGGGDKRNVTIFKGVIFLGLAAGLFAAKLTPLAFMVLLAAGAVTAIEVWRDRAIKTEEATESTQVPKVAMQPAEAASVLGVAIDAKPDEIRAAHKKLIAQLHPDKGGTDYLAAKINDARDILLKRNDGKA
jgi:hypothetical protein